MKIAVFVLGTVFVLAGFGPVGASMDALPSGVLPDIVQAGPCDPQVRVCR